MRVAINTRHLIPGQLEGIGYYTREVCALLPQLLPEAEFLFCFDRRFPDSFVRHERVEGSVLYPSARDPLLWRLWYDYRLPGLLRRWKADVFFSPDGFCSLRTDVPQVMVTHDLAFLHYRDQLPERVQRYYERYVPRFLAAASEVLTVSDFVSFDIERTYGLPAKSIDVTGNGVKAGFKPVELSIRASTRARYSDDRPYFFYLGSVHPRKNIIRLLRAYEHFRSGSEKRVLLLLGGRLAWQTEDVRNLHAASSYREDIRFLGYLEEGVLPDILGSCLAMVYPSMSEGFGVPLLEAMHAEVPIITSNRTSMPEVAGDAALYVDPEDELSIFRALARISENEDLAADLIHKGRRQRKRYTWSKTAEVVANAIKRAENA